MRVSRRSGGAALGFAVLASSTAIARSREVHEAEHRVFRSLNDLPHALHPPVYVVMQSGSLGAVCDAGGIAHKAGRHRLARGSWPPGPAPGAVAKPSNGGSGAADPPPTLTTCTSAGVRKRA